MDRAVHASPAEEGGIRRVDNGVNAEGRDVGNDDIKRRRADLKDFQKTGRRTQA